MIEQAAQTPEDLQKAAKELSERLDRGYSRASAAQTKRLIDQLVENVHGHPGLRVERWQMHQGRLWKRLRGLARVALAKELRCLGVRGVQLWSDNEPAGPYGIRVTFDVGDATFEVGCRWTYGEVEGKQQFIFSHRYLNVQTDIGVALPVTSFTQRSWKTVVLNALRMYEAESERFHRRNQEAVRHLRVAIHRQEKSRP